MAEEYKRAGWYPDPDGTPGERWWNGSGWSETQRGGAVAPSAPVVYSANNPAPQRPDPYSIPATSGNNAGPGLPKTAFSIDTRANRPALIGFILGLVSVFAINMGGPVAIVFSILGIRRARQLRSAGSISGSTIVIATIGLVTGIIATVLFIVTIVALIASFSFQFDNS